MNRWTEVEKIENNVNYIKTLSVGLKIIYDKYSV